MSDELEKHLLAINAAKTNWNNKWIELQKAMDRLTPQIAWKDKNFRRELRRKCDVCLENWRKAKKQWDQAERNYAIYKQEANKYD